MSVTPAVALAASDKILLVELARKVRREELHRSALRAATELLSEVGDDDIVAFRTQRYRDAMAAFEAARTVRVEIDNLVMATGATVRNVVAYDAALEGSVSGVEEIFSA